MKAQKSDQIRQGKTAFYAPEPCLWDMRQAAKQAVLDKQPTRQFVVTHEEMYYPNMLDQLLFASNKLLEEAITFGDALIGHVDGCLRCALLWESGWQGFLLHREGSTLLCAYVPFITSRVAEKEHQLSIAMDALAVQAEDSSIVLDKPLKAGKYSLQELLHYLSEQMDA